MREIADIQSGRLGSDQIAKNFADLHPPLNWIQAENEASRCYYCYDAPCVTACPTGIDIPQFIAQIATGDAKGAARIILQSNILGGMCARDCPTETLCEEKCVRNTEEDKPVLIGMLQRYATDHVQSADIPLFKRGPATGKKIAVVGGGPAGLACAHRAAMLGHDVTIFEAKPKLGGLNEYGIAAYKTADDFAQREVAYLLKIGGITVKTGQRLGKDVQLADLRQSYDAVFLAAGLADTNSLGIPGEELSGVIDAVDFIAELRQTKDLSKLPVGRRVVVIGGGSTAIDVASQTKRLGAEEVTICYRRGVENMNATWVEQELAQKTGCLIRTFAMPKEIKGQDGKAVSIVFDRAKLDKGKLVATGETFELPCDQIFKAIGQTLVSDVFGADAPKLDKGKIVVDAEGRTSLKGVWAGGDCASGGKDLTVWAVRDGREAAISIDRALRGLAIAAE